MPELRSHCRTIHALVLPAPPASQFNARITAKANQPTWPADAPTGRASASAACRAQMLPWRCGQTPVPGAVHMPWPSPVGGHPPTLPRQRVRTASVPDRPAVATHRWSPRGRTPLMPLPVPAVAAKSASHAFWRVRRRRACGAVRAASHSGPCLACSNTRVLSGSTGCLHLVSFPPDETGGPDLRRARCQGQADRS
ncbi:hypothetical protein BD413DRAFT_283586 [Trametes elegans]|nr:hypothetical protein BD413DRAFT_283586 [Trametes elegans]